MGRAHPRTVLLTLLVVLAATLSVLVVTPSTASAAAVMSTLPYCVQESNGDVRDASTAWIQSGSGYLSMQVQYRATSTAAWTTAVTVTDSTPAANGAVDVSVRHDGFSGLSYQTVTTAFDAADGDLETIITPC